MVGQRQSWSFLQRFRCKDHGIRHQRILVSPIIIHSVISEWTDCQNTVEDAQTEGMLRVFL